MNGATGVKPGRAGRLRLLRQRFLAIQGQQRDLYAFSQRPARHDVTVAAVIAVTA